jgi:hypothetical protein
MAGVFGGEAIMLTRREAAGRDRLLMADSRRRAAHPQGQLNTTSLTFVLPGSAVPNGQKVCACSFGFEGSP